MPGWGTFRAQDGVDLIRGSVRLVLQELIEVEVIEVIGVDPYERSAASRTSATVRIHVCRRPSPATSG
jgi:transposase-like protein